MLKVGQITLKTAVDIHYQNKFGTTYKADISAAVAAARSAPIPPHKRLGDANQRRRKDRIAKQIWAYKAAWEAFYETAETRDRTVRQEILAAVGDALQPTFTLYGPGDVEIPQQIREVLYQKRQESVFYDGPISGCPEPFRDYDGIIPLLNREEFVRWSSEACSIDKSGEGISALFDAGKTTGLIEPAGDMTPLPGGRSKKPLRQDVGLLFDCAKKLGIAVPTGTEAEDILFEHRKRGRDLIRAEVREFRGSCGCEVKSGPRGKRNPNRKNELDQLREYFASAQLQN